MFGFLRNNKALKNKDYIVVSMYGGDEYYYKAAEKLRRLCDLHNIRHDIVEVKVEGKDWIDICRMKPLIYQKKLEQHKCSIFWIDVDTEIVSFPDFPSTGFDIGLFSRGFNDLSQFSSFKQSRKFEPGYILFSYTNKTRNFLNHLIDLESQSKDVKATDDYFLQEALKSNKDSLRYLIFSKDEIARNKNKITDATCFVHGDSGNVNSNKGIAKQHTYEEIPLGTKKHIFVEKAIEYAKKGNREKAILFYEVAFELECNDLLLAEKLYILYKKNNDIKKINNLINIAQDKPELSVGFSKIQLVDLYENKEYEKANIIDKKIREIGTITDIGFCDSKQYRYSFDRKALEKNISDAQRVKMFWWEHPHPGNLGDILSPYIIEKLTNIPPKFVARNKGLLSIGSIIKWASNNSQVWGAGTSSRLIDLPADAEYFAVRGPYTRDEVLRNGGNCPEVYGDPAWILPTIYKPKVDKKYKLGVILHYTHEDTDTKFHDDVCMISIRRIGFDQIEEFVKEMMECEKIISTSLHGVIIANAYNIPVIWASCDDASRNIHGDGVKFKDYFSTVGIPEDIKPINISDYDTISSTTFSDKDFLLPSKRVDVAALINNSPFYDSVLEKYKS